MKFRGLRLLVVMKVCLRRGPCCLKSQPPIKYVVRASFPRSAPRHRHCQHQDDKSKVTYFDIFVPIPKNKEHGIPHSLCIVQCRCVNHGQVEVRLSKDMPFIGRQPCLCCLYAPPMFPRFPSSQFRVANMCRRYHSWRAVIERNSGLDRGEGGD